jgi:Leucine-rich repeat (LRR) protein/predicted Ser/Thr protein kinase
MPDQADHNRTVPLPPDQLPLIAADPDTVPGGDAGRPKFGPPVQAGEVGTLGPYRVVKELGRGGMGAVYLALDPRLDRRLALKVMLPKYAADREARERFLREARAAAKVEHINVVTVYEADERDGTPYIAMQFLQGYPLDQYLRTKGLPPLAHAVRIGREAALGLAAAHALGVIHRDIKPANLWLEVPNGRVKVLDFGLAKPLEAADELTDSGAVMGTPAYMAPEQARGEKVDARADLWSLGVVLYKLCTGRMPFDGATAMAVVMALGHDDPTPVRDLNPQVPEALAELIHQLLAKKPEQRPGTAAAVAQQLYAVLGQLLAPPAVQAIPYRPPAAPMQITAAPDDVFAHLDEPTDADATVAEEPPAPRPGRKGGRGVLVAAAGAAVLAVAVVVAVASQMGKKGSPQAAQPTDPPPAFAPAPKVTPKATPAKNRDREAAERVIGLGGWVGVEGVNKEIRDVADLPPGPLALALVDLQGVLNANDDDLARLKGLTSLGSLTLNRAAVTDAGLRHLKEFPALSGLNLMNCPGVTDAGLVHLKECKSLSSVSLCGTGVTDDGLKRLKGFDGLIHLHVCNTQVTDAGLAHLGELPALNILNLERTKVTDAGLIHLKRLDKLIQLHLGSTAVTDAGVPHLKELTELTYLDLRLTKVTGAGLEHLKGLPKLGNLVLCFTLVADADLARFAAFPALTALDLSGVGLTDTGLGHLKDCNKLTNLRLDDTAITDAGLKHLQALPALRALNVTRTRVTAKGLEAFAAAKPDCKLTYDEALAPNLPVTDRSAAEWVLARGGTVEVSGVSGKVRAAGQLPPEPFTLTGVDLAHREVGDDLSRLRGLKGLKDLNLPVSKATDRALVSLGGLPVLTGLNVSGCAGVTDAALAHLKGLKNLAGLHLQRTGVTDAGLAHLPEFPALAVLSLDATAVTDEGLGHFKGCKSLVLLGLSETAVTDEGLKHLTALDQLIALGLTNSKVTADGVAKFRAARPDCKVEWTEPKK